MESAIEKAREMLGKQPVAAPEEATPEARVTPPPSLEDDKVVQFTPKEKLVALVKQFASSPDDSLLAITVDEFGRQKQAFGLTRDVDLISSLNGTIPLIQEKNRNAIQLLVQLHPMLVGENQAVLRSILARGFDFAPTLTVNLLNKFEQDKTCTLVMTTPEDVASDERFSYLENRLSVLAPARLVAGQSQYYILYVDTCLSQLQLELNKERARLSIPASDPSVAPDSATAPLPTETPTTPPPTETP